jgi:hypothetical protein
MRAISMPRVSRTVIDATTSSRASFSLTLLRRMSRIDNARPSLAVLSWPDPLAGAMLPIQAIGEQDGNYP